MPDNIIETYAGLEGRELIKAVFENHQGRLALVSSFGAESAVLLHMVSEVDSALPVIFLETGKLFPETLRYRDELVSMMGLTDVRSIKPEPRDLLLSDPSGQLHRSDTDACCYVRKTLPLKKAVQGFDAMISGRKRFHGALRSDLEFVSMDEGVLKVEPLAAFSSLDIRSYMTRHHLPNHPLKLQGYLSIGCEPCTTLGGSEIDPRAGRWEGSEKTECGIHFAANGQIFRTVQREAVNA